MIKRNPLFKMKNIIQLVFAGVLGGIIAFSAFKYFEKDTIIFEEIPPRTFNTNSVSTPSASFDFVKAAEKANPAVVHISAENEEYSTRSTRYEDFGDFWGFRRNRGERPQAGTGSGVLISKDGYIVTNNHVVGFADHITVDLHDGKQYNAVKIGTDPSTDLAVIKIEGDQFPSLEVANSDNVKIGQWVVAVGNPFNLTSTVTAGIVSAKGRDLDIIQGQKTIEEFIQTDAVVNPGNSGGALVDTEGKLIGINTAISSPTGVYAGYSFAIPSNLVQRVVLEILETGGDIQRGMLGIMIADVKDVKDEGIKVDLDQGVFVTNFTMDRFGRRGFSSAEVAGVDIGDIILGVNDKKITNSEDLTKAIRFAKIGDTLDVTVYRKGKQKTIPVKLRRGI